MPELTTPARLVEKEKLQEAKLHRARQKLMRRGLMNIEHISFLGVPLWKFTKDEIYTIGLWAESLDKNVGQIGSKDLK
jgi:hypothetical protein